MGRAMKNAIMGTVVSLAVLVAGCADISSITRNDAREVVLDSNGKAYVSIPADGRYGNKIYTGSGQTAAGIVLGAFSTRMLHVDLAERSESFEDSLSKARAGNYKYLIAQKITHWEDRATQWSGRPSKASLNIRIVDVATGAMIDSVVIDTRSSAVRMSDPAPEDALPAPVRSYVNSLTFI